MNIDSADPEPPNLQPTYAECFAPITYPMDGLHTQQTMVCADQSSLYFSPTPMDDSKNPSPNPSHSGSSAHNSSDCTDEDTFERDEELSSFPSSESPQDHGFISDASPICVLESEITYGVDRLIFVEELIWNCTSQFHTIYGELINEPRPPPGHPLDVLVHEGLVHGLCNEIVILPVMAAIQKTQGDPTQHQADQIPFPLFVAEMLRRMRASYFLFRTAMQYVLDIERQIQMARERSKCGWCLSGVYGCSHFDAPERSVASRFSKGRTAINRKPKSGVPGVIPASHFTKSDPLFPLADPRKAFLGALILANKFHRDRSIGNKSWATLIGLSLEEVHSAERAVGQALGWTLSRPWVSNEKDSNGLPMFGPIHATFSEPLFATTEIEVDRYGVRELREQGNLPPPLKLPPMIAALSSERAVASLMESDGILHPSRSLRRIRSQQHLGDERRIAPLPQRQQSLNTPKLGNPIKKASSAPFVLQPHASGYGDGPHPFHEEMIDAVVMSDWGAYPSGPQGADGWMDATPTLEQYRSKRKASHDFGPKALFRRGDQGQRMRVFSPDVSTQSGTASASLSNPSQSQWDMCDMEEDGIPPELSIDTPTASSPSEGPLTRTSTPANLNAVAMGEYGSPGSNSWKFQPLSRTLSSSRIHGSYSSTHHTKLAHGSLPGASMNALHQ